MLTFFLKPSTIPDTVGFEATSTDVHGQDFTITGTYELRDADSNPVEYVFTMKHPAAEVNGEDKITYFRGTLDEDGMNLLGSWGNTEEDRPWAFLFTRVAPEVLVCRPSPGAFQRHRIRALWSYARAATLSEVRRTLFSWSYLKERRDLRKKYLDILHRQAEESFSQSDPERLMRLHRKMTCDDVKYCHALVEHNQVHPSVLLW